MDRAANSISDWILDLVDCKSSPTTAFLKALFWKTAANSLSRLVSVVL
jgi:hypothetical protein